MQAFAFDRRISAMSTKEDGSAEQPDPEDTDGASEVRESARTAERLQDHNRPSDDAGGVNPSRSQQSRRPDEGARPRLPAPSRGTDTA